MLYAVYWSFGCVLSNYKTRVCGCIWEVGVAVGDGTSLILQFFESTLGSCMLVHGVTVVGWSLGRKSFVGWGSCGLGTILWRIFASTWIGIFFGHPSVVLDFVHDLGGGGIVQCRWCGFFLTLWLNIICSNDILELVEWLLFRLTVLSNVSYSHICNGEKTRPIILDWFRILGEDWGWVLLELRICPIQRGKDVSTLIRPNWKYFLYVQMVPSAALMRWIHLYF